MKDNRRAYLRTVDRHNKTQKLSEGEPITDIKNDIAAYNRIREERIQGAVGPYNVRREDAQGEGTRKEAEPNAKSSNTEQLRVL